jgi:hypothetical protein
MILYRLPAQNLSPSVPAEAQARLGAICGLGRIGGAVAWRRRENTTKAPKPANVAGCDLGSYSRLCACLKAPQYFR